MLLVRRSAAIRAAAAWQPAASRVRLLSTASSEPYDVIIVGGGPGGYPAAIKAGQVRALSAIDLPS